MKHSFTLLSIEKNRALQDSTQVFISDVHLGAFDDQTNQKIEDDLLALIRHCRSLRASIFILGDLFDYWMEYPNQIQPLGAAILYDLSDYSKNIAPVTYITGNHDNWTLGHFEQLGLTVESEFIEINDNSVLLLHGDGISDPNFNLPRPLMHRILRNRNFISLYRKIFPAPTGVWLMKKFSSINRYFGKENTMKLDKWAKEMLKNSSYDKIVCGHDHIPRKETFPFGTYINLGTFFDHRIVLVNTNGQFNLVRWSADEKSFTENNFKQSKI